MHVIRLRKPWDKSAGDGLPSKRVDVPESAEDDAHPGATVWYRRAFNAPTGLGATTRVHLRIESWRGRLDSVSLNGTRLNADPNSLDCDVTALLQKSNEVVVQLSGSDGQSPRMSGAVSLAIDERDSA